MWKKKVRRHLETRKIQAESRSKEERGVQQQKEDPKEKEREILSRKVEVGGRRKEERGRQGKKEERKEMESMMMENREKGMEEVNGK